MYTLVRQRRKRKKSLSREERNARKIESAATRCRTKQQSIKTKLEEEREREWSCSLNSFNQIRNIKVAGKPKEKRWEAATTRTTTTTKTEENSRAAADALYPAFLGGSALELASISRGEDEPSRQRASCAYTLQRTHAHTRERFVEFPTVEKYNKTFFVPAFIVALPDTKGLLCILDYPVFYILSIRLIHMIFLTPQKKFNSRTFVQYIESKANALVLADQRELVYLRKVKRQRTPAFLSASEATTALCNSAEGDIAVCARPMLSRNCQAWSN